MIKVQELSSYRRTVSLTQDQVAKKLGVTQEAVSQWESGSTRPDIKFISNLARIYGVTEGEIISAVTGGDAARTDAGHSAHPC